MTPALPRNPAIERSPNAYATAVFLHAAVAALLVFLAFDFSAKPAEEPRIIELVAGGGSNYAATEAPALGVPGGIRLHLPQMPVVPPAPPMPAPPESAPAPVPVPEAVPAPAPRTHAAPRHPASRSPDFARSMERTAHRREVRTEARYRRQLELERRREMTYEQFLKDHPSANSPAGRAAPGRIDTAGILAGVEGGSAANQIGGAGGRALTREDADLMDAYFAFLKARLKDNVVNPSDVGNEMTAQVGFYLAADGSMSRVRILRSSGSADFDQAVLDAFRHTRPIGPRPDGRSEEVEMEFDTKEDAGSN